LPDEAVVVECGILEENGWQMASVVDLLTAEAIYNQTGKQTNRLLLRKRIFRDYSGKENPYYRLQIAPIYIDKPFRFKVKYLAPLHPAVWYFYAYLPIWQFYMWDYKMTPLNLYFWDMDNPEGKAVLQAGVRYGPRTFQQRPDGTWYLQVHEADLTSSSLVLFFWHPLPHLYEFRSFSDSNGNYFHLMIRPPFTQLDAGPRRVLLIYDVTEDLPGYSIPEILGGLEMVLRAGLFDTDSVNVLLMDFIPKFLRGDFIPAVAENVTALLTEIKNAPQPRVSALPQLLRTAVRYFNEKGKGGEIWLFTTARKHSNPVSVANDILDLTVRRLQVPVAFRILDCSDPEWRDRIYINGIWYTGNAYLYENLARLSRGTVFFLRSIPKWAFSFTLQDLFFPAIDEAEVEFRSRGGFVYNKYLLHWNRTHFPNSFPYVVLGKFSGNTPFTVDYFGHLNGILFHKILVADSLIQSSASEWLAVYWHASYSNKRLREPQSHALIDEIGRLSVQYGFLSPYSGFVIPGPAGFSGFQRLSAEDRLPETQESIEPLPEEFELEVYPNPFRSRLRIAMRLSPESVERQGTVIVFNMLGQIVMKSAFAVLPGMPQVFWEWDGRRSDGSLLPSGLYVIRVSLGEIQKTVKITYLR
jgi:hypothetical protein